MKHFSASYKPADAPGATQEQIEESDEEMSDHDDDAVKEDHVASSAEYKAWRSLCKANAALLTLISDFASTKLAEGDDDDDEYEEVDEDFGKAEETKGEEKSGEANLILLRSFDMCLARCQAVPQYLGLTHEIEENLDEVQEAAYSMILNALQVVKAQLSPANKEEVVGRLKAVVTTTNELIEKNLYKCERNVYSRALSVLRFLVTDFSKALPESRVRFLMFNAS